MSCLPATAIAPLPRVPARTMLLLRSESNDATSTLRTPPQTCRERIGQVSSCPARAWMHWLREMMNVLDDPNSVRPTCPLARPLLVHFTHRGCDHHACSFLANMTKRAALCCSTTLFHFTLLCFASLLPHRTLLHFTALHMAPFTRPRPSPHAPFNKEGSLAPRLRGATNRWPRSESRRRSPSGAAWRVSAAIILAVAYQASIRTSFS
jgi:hypothetical protein